ncbi:MAG: HAMP domain-containing sensor histidine kinase [Oscillospiraceae bacterium]
MKKAKTLGLPFVGAGLILAFACLCALVIEIINNKAFFPNDYIFFFAGVFFSIFLVIAGLSSIIRATEKLRQAENAASAASIKALEERLETEREDNIENIRKLHETTRNEIETFRRVLSHQLRMPLSIVQGYADVLARELVEDEEEKRSYFQKIQERIKSIADIISRQFSVNRSLEEAPPTFEELDIVHLLRRASEDMQTIARAQGIKIQVLSTEDSYLINADAEKLNKVVFNLLENSIKYMGREGMITIYTEFSNDKVAIIFKDDGVGLPAAEVSNIFEANFQGSNKSDGNGLGLYLVKRVAEVHGGTISAESDTGLGMTIRMTLPRHRPTAE